MTDIKHPEIVAGSQVYSLVNFETHLIQREIYTVTSRQYGHVYIKRCSYHGKCQYDDPTGRGCGGHPPTSFELYVETPLTPEEIKSAVSLPSVESAASFFGIKL